MSSTPNAKDLTASLHASFDGAVFEVVVENQWSGNPVGESYPV